MSQRLIGSAMRKKRMRLGSWRSSKVEHSVALVSKSSHLFVEVQRLTVAVTMCMVLTQSYLKLVLVGHVYRPIVQKWHVS